jgi:hypothetical protein
MRRIGRIVQPNASALLPLDDRAGRMHDRGYEPDARGGCAAERWERSPDLGNATSRPEPHRPLGRLGRRPSGAGQPAAIEDAHNDPTQPDAAILAAQNLIKECDTKLDRYRQALDAGADPAVVTTWITQTQVERRNAESIARGPSGQPAPGRMTSQQLNDLVNALGDIIATLAEADPTDKADVYRRLGLRLTYDPHAQTVRAEADLNAHRWGTDRVRGEIDTITPHDAPRDLEIAATRS